MALILEASLPIIGRPETYPKALLAPVADDGRVPCPPRYVGEIPKPRDFYRVVGYGFLFGDRLQWHRERKLHAHLGCMKIRVWLAGGSRGAGGGRPDREYPPKPPTLAVERFAPCDTPRWMRCHYCWGPLADVPEPFWRPDFRDPYWPTPDGEYRASKASMAIDFFEQGRQFWDSIITPPDRMRFVVWDGQSFVPRDPDEKVAA